jgi:carbonic anhydrase
MRLSAFFVVFSVATTCMAQSRTNWTYEGKAGPLVWGKLDPAYEACSKGKEQSPIDIRGARLNKALQPLQFHFVAGPTTLENTGRGIIAHMDPGSEMVAGDEHYQLIQIEFHHPSEHPVKGKLSDLEADLLFRSQEGREAIVGVRLNEDRSFPNALLSTLWAHLPTRAGTSAKVNDMVSAGGLVPSDPGYWTYMGSELTPPCTEDVRWLVFEEDLSISRSQLKAFTDLFRMNTRPLQDPHGRKIEANE